MEITEPGKQWTDSFLYILERKENMIISGGVNIFSIDLKKVIAGTRGCKMRRCSAFLRETG